MLVKNRLFKGLLFLVLAVLSTSCLAFNAHLQAGKVNNHALFGQGIFESADLFIDENNEQVELLVTYKLECEDNTNINCDNDVQVQKLVTTLNSKNMDSCGSIIYSASVDSRRSGGNIHVLSIFDNSHNTCPSVHEIWPVEVVLNSSNIYNLGRDRALFFGDFVK